MAMPWLVDELAHLVYLVACHHHHVCHLVAVAHVLVAIAFGGLVVDLGRIDGDFALAKAIRGQKCHDGLVVCLDFGIYGTEVVAHFLGHDWPCDFVGLYFFFTKAAHCDYAVAVAETVDAALEGKAEDYDTEGDNRRGDNQ